MTLLAGKLTRRFEIQTPTEVFSTTTGQATETFKTAVKRWGSLEQLTGTEEYDAHQVAAGATHKVVIRYCKELTERCQLKLGKRIFAIKGIWTDEKGIPEFQTVFVAE